MTLFYIRVIVDWLIGVYLTILFIRMILSWVAVLSRWQPRGVMYTLVDAVYRLTDPPLNALRRHVPPLPLGPGMSLDTSFLVLYMLLVFLQWLI